MAPQLTHARASSERFGWYGAARLLADNPELHPRWNAGRHAPVTLALGLSRPALRIGFCPDMCPPSGEVGIVLVDQKTGARAAHLGAWTDKEWVDVCLPCATDDLRVEFASSPSWIALRAVRFDF